MLRFIPINDTDAIAKVSIEVKSDTLRSNRCLIYAIDKSGSMSGRPIQNAKEGLITALEDNINKFSDIMVVIYESYSSQKEVNHNNLSQVISDIRNIDASGGTSFSNMFIGVTSIVNNYVNKYNGDVDIFLYVFSDGMDSGFGNSQQIDQNKKTLQSALRHPSLIKNGGRTYCKTRAFSNGVDVGMMEGLTHIGTEAGDFCYAFSSAEIKDILSKDEHLNQATRSGYLVFPNGEKIRLEFSNSGEGKSEAITNIVMEQIKTGLPHLSLFDGKTEQDYKLEAVLVKDTEENSYEIFEAFLLNFGLRLRNIANDLVHVNGDKNLLDFHVASLRTLDKEIQTAYEAKYASLKGRLARKKYGTQYNTLRQQLNDVINSTVNLVRDSSSGALAKILHVGHQAAKRGLQNRLNTLALAGAAKIEESEKKLLELSQKQDRTAIENKFQDHALRCMISLSSVSDAILDQDILCLTGYMSRSEAAIGSSDQIKIQEINSLENTILWSVFCDELVDKLSSMEYPERAKLVHGGFDITSRAKNATGVMKSAYRGALNYAYPLYIDADHWEVAKHYFPQIVAWMPTLDFAAQTFEQIKTVPFVMVLASIMRLIENPSESNILIFLNIARVARQLVEEYNMKHISANLEEWQKSYAGRVPKNISNVMIFLTKLLFLQDMPELSLEFWQSVIDEQMRRVLPALDVYTEQTDPTGRKFRSISKPFISENFVAEQCNYLQYVPETVSSNIDELYYAKLANPDAVLNEKEEYKAPVFLSENLVLKNDMIDNLIATFSKKFENSFRTIQILRHVYNWFRTVDRDALFAKLDSVHGFTSNTSIFDEFKTLTEFKYDGDFSKFDIDLYPNIVLNYKHSDNTVRETSSVPELKYRDSSILKTEVERSIQAEKSRRDSLANQGSYRKLVELFASTTDLNVAAGIIIGKCPDVGAPIFRPLFIELQELKLIPHRLAKLKMVVKGEYDDGVRKTKIFRAKNSWSASKKNRNRLIYAYKKYNTDEVDWIDIFPKMTL